jgi:hypothetical protein
VSRSRRLLASACTVVLAAGATVAMARRSDAVVHGAPVDARWVPFMVALLDANRPSPFNAQFCGGQYVDTHWVLTAAHCVTWLPAERIDVASGITNLSAIRPADRRQVVQKIVHPHYSATTHRNDVALLRLARPVPPQWVVPMNTSPGFPVQGSGLAVYGWGLTSGGYADALQGGNVTDLAGAAGRCGAFPTVDLPGRLPAFLPQYEICAQGAIPGVHDRSVDACAGDSGGPLVASTPGGPLLVGTVSKGTYCGAGPGVWPGIYMRVSAYAGWIAGTIAAATPLVSIADANVVEGNPYYGNKTMRLRVSLNRPVGHTVRVGYTTHAWNATPGSDYRVAMGVVAIPPGERARWVEVTVVSDRVREPTEHLLVALVNPAIAKLGRSVAAGTIYDND